MEASSGLSEAGRESYSQQRIIRLIFSTILLYKMSGL